MPAFRLMIIAASLCICNLQILAAMCPSPQRTEQAQNVDNPDAELAELIAKTSDRKLEIENRLDILSQSIDQMRVQHDRATIQLEKLQKSLAAVEHESEQIKSVLSVLREHLDATEPVIINSKEMTPKQVRQNAELLLSEFESRAKKKIEIEAMIDTFKKTQKLLVGHSESATGRLNAVKANFARLKTKLNELQTLKARLIDLNTTTHPIGELIRQQVLEVDAIWLEANSAEPDGGPIRVDEWQPIFNGHDLEGWKPKIRGYEFGENFGETFRVEDGLLKVAYDQYEDGFGKRFGHLFYHEKVSHYLLRIEYRFVGDQISGGPGWAFRNSGVMLHCQDPTTMGKEQDFPVSIEMQMLGGNGTDPRPNANVCTPGTHIEMNGELVTRHCINSTSDTYHGDQWVTVEVEVRGGEVIRHKIDGETVLEYQNPQLDPGDANAKALIVDEKVNISEGFIAVQSESHPMEIRKIEIKRFEQ